MIILILDLAVGLSGWKLWLTHLLVSIISGMVPCRNTKRGKCSFRGIKTGFLEGEVLALALEDGIRDKQTSRQGD